MATVLYTLKIIIKLIRGLNKNMFYANGHLDWKNYDYILGEGNHDMSIAVQRYYHLMELTNLSKDDDVLLSFKDNVDSDKWTKWQTIYKYTHEQLMFGYDIHRSIIYNEVLVESDYPTYEENWEATRLIGSILEHKGFKPMYYYSGNKSIHTHVYFDFKCLLECPIELQTKVLETFKWKKSFIKAFMAYLRMKMITCWGMNNREFDKDLAKAKHLIRSELSRNKKGYKTFLGYNYKDVPPIPYVCNEEEDNRIYPKIGLIKLSRPNNPTELLKEFLQQQTIDKSKQKIRRKEYSLTNWLNGNDPKEVKGCVKYILSDEFTKSGDGHNRAMFILVNELRRCIGEVEAIKLVKDWNFRMGEQVREVEIDYRFRLNKEYTLNHEFIHNFLSELGFGFEFHNCKHS